MENIKSAKLELHLIAESSYESSETVKVSPNQWKKIMRIINETERKNIEIELSNLRRELVNEYAISNEYQEKFMQIINCL